MTPKAAKERRRIGRPPAGARDGEKVKDYPQLSIRLPGEVKAKLQALSLIASKPQWRIITDAIDCYLRERPEPERRMVDELAGRVEGARPRRARAGGSGSDRAARSAARPRSENRSGRSRRGPAR